MIIEILQVGQLGANCYILAGDQGGPGVVIDPGGEPDKILATAKRRNIEIVKILDTHGHWDHVDANAALAEATGADIMVNQEDARMLTDPILNLSVVVAAEERTQEVKHFLNDGDILKFGDLTIKAIHTPGHTLGSTSFLAEDNLFSGDLIFQQSVGRTDLPGGNGSALYQSIREKVMTLPDDVVIYPGHGPSTTVGGERSNNPYREYWISE